MPSTTNFKKSCIKLIMLITILFSYASQINAQVRIFLPFRNQVIPSGNNIVLEFTTMAIPGECIAQLYLGTNYIKTYYNVLPDIENNLSSVGLAPGTTYRLKVMDDGDNGYAWSQYFTIGGLAAPTAYAASSIGSTSFRANWSSPEFDT